MSVFGRSNPQSFSHVKLLVEKGVMNSAHRARLRAPEHAAARAVGS